jgi:hypothetical protein
MKEDVVEPVTIFAGEKIMDEDPKQIYVGLLALGAIVEGPN